MSTNIVLALSLLFVLSLSWRDMRRKRELKGDKPEEYISFKKDYDLLYYWLLEKIPKHKFFGRLSLGVLPSTLLIVAIIPLLLYLVVSKVDDSWTLPGRDGLGLLEDYIGIYIILGSSLLIYMFYRVIRDMPAAFRSLARTDDDDESEDSINPAVDELIRQAASVIFQTKGGRTLRWIVFESILGIILAILFVSIMSPSLGSEGRDIWWNSPHNLGTIVGISVLCVLTVYFLRIGFTYMLRIALSMYRLGKKLDEGRLLAIDPLHPDGAGGLAPFGRLAWSIDLLLLPIVLLIPFAIMYEGVSIFTISLTALACVTIPIFFFVPLWGVHRGMARAKRQELDEIAKQFRRVRAIVRRWRKKDISIPQEEGLAASETLERMILLHEHVSKMPVWPINMSTITWVGIYLMIPVVMMALEATITLR